MDILLSSSPDSLFEALLKYDAYATVEAEYGDRVVEGNVLTLAHHGPRSGAPAPCLFWKEGISYQDKVKAIGISHIDLDTIGGIMSILGNKFASKDYESFWELVAFVDVNGLHRIAEANATEEDIDRLYGFYALRNQMPKIVASDQATNVTDWITQVIAFLGIILRDSSYFLIDVGRNIREEEAEANKKSFLELTSNGLKKVIIRVSDSFVNHFYISPDGVLADCVIAYNTLYGSITISFAEDQNISCTDIVQEVWGAEAGGHKGIAGSPRNERMYLRDLVKVKETVFEFLGRR